MILMAVFAVVSAALGLYAKPRWLGVAVAVTLAAMIECAQQVIVGILVNQPNREHLIGQLRAIFGETPAAAIGPVAASLIAGALAVVMGGVMDRDRPAMVVTADGIRRKAGKDGRYARLDGMVEDRQIHAKAESRIDKILGL